MNQQQPARPAPRPPVTTPQEARKLAEEMMDVMSKLLAVVDQETGEDLEAKEAAERKAQAAQEKRNALSKEIGQAKAKKDEARAAELMAQVAAIKESLPAFEAEEKAAQQKLDETLAANHMKKSDVDWLIPHQANIRIIQATAKKLKLPTERVVITVDQHGNTSAASVPLALDTAVRDGRIKRGETLLMEAFGGGFTWGSALLKF